MKTKVFLKRFKSDIDTSGSFCGDPNETDMDIFWDCSLNNILWNIEISYNKQNIVFYCIS